MMATALQQACLRINEKSGPLCRFLLVGSEETGKKLAAKTLAKHLFDNEDALIQINLKEEYQSLDETGLLKAIQHIPYAVILIENITQSHMQSLSLFKEVLHHGIIYRNGKKYDFRQSIFVLTTHLGAEKFSSLIESTPAQESHKALDLMQLVLNENVPTTSTPSLLSSREMIEELHLILANFFPANLLQQLTVIPFLPLDFSAYEKIIRFKIKSLAYRLSSQYQLELIHAPEVIKFLAHESFWRKPHLRSLQSLLEEYIYSPVANEILLHAEDKNRPKRLLVKLNEDGQMLRCEFMNTALYI